MTEFIYNGQKYSTFNLKKELRKLGISQNDITIVESKKVEVVEEKVNYPCLTLYNPIDMHSYIFYFNDFDKVPNLITSNDIIEWCYKQEYLMYDKNNGTGWLLEEVAKKLIPFKGQLKYPIIIDQDTGYPYVENNI